MPCHDDGRTHCAPTRSLGTNLPPAQSPRDRDDELPLLTLRSWLQSITTINCLTDAVALTDTVDPGFFLLPTDPDSNNKLVYVLKSWLVDHRVLGMRKL
jgi:hypothetical protein